MTVQLFSRVAGPDVDYPWLTPSFGVVATGIAIALTGYATFLQPVLGWRRYRRLRRDRATDPDALLRFFRRAATVQAIGVLLVLLALVTSAGLDRYDIGLRWPTGEHVHTGVAWTAFALFVVAVSGIVLRRRALSGRPVPGQKAVIALIPRTAVERRMGAVVAVGAGVAEEFVFRGLFVAAGVDLLGLSAVAALTISSVIFALAHVYQGVAPLPLLLLIGFSFGWLYLVTQSLLLPVLIHAAMDVRGLVLVPAEHAEARERAH
ncbi:MAG TPA: CPBP family intramembrane glutamic endopeptidase [Jatrophihabitantaceae bacterium]|nr:CPBP family intramembrane glutamic endopeptidase [Jatrophihabitantaceae bacterium]